MNIHQALEPLGQDVTLNKRDAQFCRPGVQMMLDQQALTGFFQFHYFLRELVSNPVKEKANLHI